MKTFFKSATIVAVAIVMACFTGCQQEENEGANNGPKEVSGAYLNISLVNPTNTRVAGPVPETDNTVSNFSVFVVDENGNATWKTHVTGTSLSDFPVTTAAAQVYVIANAGNQTANYSTKTALDNAVIDLYTSATSDVDQYSKRWATGSETITWGTADKDTDGIIDYSAKIDLTFVAARIVVTVNNQMAGYTGADDDGTVNINTVALMNVRGQSKLFGTSLIPTYSPAKMEFMGYPNTGFANSPATYGDNPDNIFNNDYDPTVTPGATEDDPSTVEQLKYFFYVFESPAATDAGDFPTIVTLKGTDTEGDDVYFPIHLASYETWAGATKFAADKGIVHGNSYNVTITLKGDATVGTGGGTDDPTENVVNTELFVTLDITDWAAVELEKEF